MEEKKPKFEFTEKDIHTLLDLFYMCTWHDYKVLKLNKMEKWFEDFVERLERYCLK